MTKVKICGVRTLANALEVAHAGADMIGLNFYPPSPRSVDMRQGRTIAEGLRGELGDACPTLVGVFVNASANEMRATIQESLLDFAQLSGDEDTQALVSLCGTGFKSIRPRDIDDAVELLDAFTANMPTDKRAPSILVDAFNPRLYGGTGETASLAVAEMVKSRVPRMMLAGGLNPDNVAKRVRAIRPWAVDVASGVESGEPDIKDMDKVRAFIAAVRSAS